MNSVFFIMGLLITFGSVGTLDYDPKADVLTQTVLALIGIGVMALAARSFRSHGE